MKRSDVTVPFLFFMFYFPFQCQRKPFALAVERPYDVRTIGGRRFESRVLREMQPFPLAVGSTQLGSDKPGAIDNS